MFVFPDKATQRERNQHGAVARDWEEDKRVPLISNAFCNGDFIGFGAVALSVRPRKGRAARATAHPPVDQFPGRQRFNTVFVALPSRCLLYYYHQWSANESAGEIDEQFLAPSVAKSAIGDKGLCTGTEIRQHGGYR